MSKLNPWNTRPKKVKHHAKILARKEMEKGGKWALDVSNLPLYAEFVPFKEDGTLDYARSKIGDRCIGNLCGVVHPNGQEYAKIWLSKPENKKILGSFLNKNDDSKLFL